jgi:hypothetical protein
MICDAWTISVSFGPLLEIKEEQPTQTPTIATAVQRRKQPTAREAFANPRPSMLYPRQGSESVLRALWLDYSAIRQWLRTSQWRTDAGKVAFLGLIVPSTVRWYVRLLANVLAIDAASLRHAVADAKSQSPVRHAWDQPPDIARVVSRII